jgi:hypothetical protein
MRAAFGDTGVLGGGGMRQERELGLRVPEPR